MRKVDRSNASVTTGGRRGSNSVTRAAQKQKSSPLQPDNRQLLRPSPAAFPAKKTALRPSSPANGTKSSIAVRPLTPPFDSLKTSGSRPVTPSSLALQTNNAYRPTTPTIELQSPVEQGDVLTQQVIIVVIQK
jgi:hypothetical protein